MHGPYRWAAGARLSIQHCGCRRNVLTIEGVSGKVAEAVQSTWTKLDVPQCGYCQSGQVMAAIGLLSNNRKPTDQDIDDAMSGNICRCNTYQRIRAAIHEAAKLLEV
jgi:isoquinoline 1-oxidoreductase alpha subunit